MNYPAIKNQLDVLFSLQRKEIKLGLEHTHALLDYLHNPEKNLKMIHIAGTNGKGSTAAFISSILIEKGYKVGVFTSPHLIKFNERIRVNSNFITDLEILEFLNVNENAIKKIQSTFFETTTAMALSHFKNQDVDFAVIETGLGGRLDATNVIKPLVSLITSISLDHMDLLGSTIEKIAYEKAGIIKKNTPLIIGPNKKSVVDVFKKIGLFDEENFFLYWEDVDLCKRFFSFKEFNFAVSKNYAVHDDNVEDKISNKMYKIYLLSTYNFFLKNTPFRLGIITCLVSAFVRSIKRLFSKEPQNFFICWYIFFQALLTYYFTKPHNKLT